MRLVLTALLGVVVPLIACAQTYSIETFAGGGLPPNALGTSIGFFLPQSVAVDNRGNVYFADRAYVFRLDATTSILTVVAGSGAMGFSGYNGRATSAQLNNPHGVAVDATGSLYIADWVNNRVRKVTSGVITTIAGTGSQGFSGDNGPATSAQLNQPQGVSVDSTGSLYIADWGNHRIRKVTDGVITTVAGNGTPGFSGDGGPAAAAQLNDPVCIAVDPANHIYFADNSRIRVVSGGVIDTVAGTASQQIQAGGIAVDTIGDLYIADRHNFIRKVKWSDDHRRGGRS